MIKLLIFIIIMGALIGFIWHDEIGVWLKSFQEKAEEEAPGLINQGFKQARDWWEEKGEGWVDEFVASLTAQGKEKIDTWLEERNLNQYGDSKDTMYTGGTPLFNEATSETIDRYVHLLKKFPELVEQLDLDKYLTNQ